MKTYNSYKFRMYPTPEQEELLFKTIGAVRKMYNLLLEGYNANYELYKNEEISKKEYFQNRNAVKPVTFTSREEYDYLAEVDSTALKYAYKHVKQAFNNFFAGRAKKPVFKSRNRSKWTYTTCRASKTAKNLRLTKNGKLYLPKMTKNPIKVVVSKNPVGTLVSATIEKTRSGKWFVSLQYEHHTKMPVYPQTLEELKNPIGVDMGLKELAVTSEGELFTNPKHAYKAKKRLAKLDRSLSRKREQAKRDGRDLKDCKNYQKAKEKRAKAYEKVRNQREDALHKITTDLVNNHDFIAVEDLSAENLKKNHNLAFAISDASWRSFLAKLEYKAENQGKVVQTIDRYYASTQTCSCCGSITGPKGYSELSVREWECSECGSQHDRDVNATINILNKGLEEFIAVGTTVGCTLK